MKNTPPWPEISYFKEGTPWAKQVMAKLELVETIDWYDLFKSSQDGTYWRLAKADKYQTRYLEKIHSIINWEAYDTTELQKQLLIENRGGLSTEPCGWSGCAINVVKGSAFCVNHTYEMGVRE